LKVSDAEMIPSIRIHVDQQLAFDAVRGAEEVEDAALATEITGFDVEDDAYVLKGALSFTGFLRQEDAASLSEEIPDALDDRDVFETGEDVPEAHVIPLHHRLPFVLQVPVAAQQEHQRLHGILDVNPKIGQWNAHVLGEGTVHLRAELVIQGLSGAEGYVFRCGTQEEGVSAQKLDQLLDEDESRNHLPAPELHVQEEFEPPFEPAWNVEEAARSAKDLQLEPEAADEDDWVIESPAGTAEEQEDAFVQEKEREDSKDDREIEVVFTPDPSLVFPMPKPGTEWAKQLEEADLFIEEAKRYQHPFDLPKPQVSFGYDQTPGTYPFAPPRHDFGFGRMPFRSEQVNPSFDPYDRAEDDENAFVLETEDRSEQVQQVQVTEHVEVVEQVEVIQAKQEHHEHHEQEDHHDHHKHHGHHHDHDHHHFDDESRPFEAEYMFEDEVLEEKTEVKAVEEKPQGPVGPKLSFGTKPVQKEETPIKLSSLLGDFRPRDAESSSSSHHAAATVSAAEEALQREPSSSHHAAATVSAAEEALQRESSSSHHAAATVSAAEEALQRESSSSHHEGHSASVHAKAHDEDSFWSDMLISQSETKVTMKFRIVQEDDTLKLLAEKYNTSVSDLLRANNLQNQDLDVGQILYIPASRR
jgi:LysM repeat protein